MRLPSDGVVPPGRLVRRYQVLLVALVIVILVGLIVVQQLASVFTNYLWYRSVGGDAVWRTMTAVKFELDAFFVGLFFAACWVSLLIVDRVARRALFMAPEQEFIRRYQSVVGGHKFVLRTVVSAIVALAVGSSAGAQWQNWLLFIHARNFGIKDPQFGRDVGFYVFKLPFLSFLVDWTQVALIVLFIVCVGAYYLNGGVRFSGPPPRVDPRAISHLSVLLAAMALLRAAAYFYVDRFELNLTPNGLIQGLQGAGYTAVHVRLPAIELLVVVALICFAIFVYNVYSRGWLLPLVAAGLWAFVAISVGVVIPAFIQWFKVTPAQSSLETKYIERNIAATREAFNLNGVTATPFDANSNASPGVVSSVYGQSLNDVDLWDPTISSTVFQNEEKIKGYYSVNGVSLDRYRLQSGKTTSMTPVAVGVREISNQLNRNTWVNSHLVFTHGYGAIMATANAQQTSTNFVMSNVPVATSSGAPALSQPDVYYGLGETGYVVANSAQAEFDYVSGTKTVNSHYSGGGGIRVGGFWQKAAFALRFHDFNLLVSNLVTPNSRIMFNQDVRTLVQNLAPFLTVDSNPYPVIVDGQIDWVVDAYTTSSYYPYAQPVSTTALPSNSGLRGNYNYLRNSVKAVVNAYTGKVTLYAVDPTDPILEAWEATFPGMFHPLSTMNPLIQQHLRYPADLLTVEATMYGKYHITPQQAPQLYNNEAAWAVAQSSAGANAPYVPPVYQLLDLPGTQASSSGGSPPFSAFLPLVPQGSGTKAQNLTAFMVADCSYANYGKLTSFQVPTSNSLVLGPALANSKMVTNQYLDGRISLNDQHGSRVVTGPTLIVPIDDSLLYLKAFFASSTTNPLPQLFDIAAVYGSKVVVGTTINGPDGVIPQLFGASTQAVSPTQPVDIPTEIKAEIDLANTLENQAISAAKSGNWSLYGADTTRVHTLLDEAEAQLAKLKSSTHPKSSTTSTTTVPPSSTVPSTTATSNPTTTTTKPRS